MLCVDYTTNGDSPFGLFGRFLISPFTGAGVCELRQRSFSPGAQGEWMTSAGEAGGNRRTAGHELPSLVNGVSS